MDIIAFFAYYFIRIISDHTSCIIISTNCLVEMKVLVVATHLVLVLLLLLHLYSNQCTSLL